MKFYLQNLAILCVLLSVFSCSYKTSTEDEAKKIIGKSIEVHGGANYRNMDVSFTFRQYDVHLLHQDGQFLYERTTRDSAGNIIVDRLTNDGFTRTINDEIQKLSGKEFDKYHEGINSIAYFSLLPYKLSEPAVMLTNNGEGKIENNLYDKITVSFTKDGGGKDYHDEFCYWINKATHTMDYLAYASGGPRFRKATRRQVVDGIIFQDYENYEIMDSTLAPCNYDNAFLNGKARLLSKIEQTNLRSR